MKCVKCDSEIPKGNIFCPCCGAEVRLVPDYESLDDLLKWHADNEKSQNTEEDTPSRPRLTPDKIKKLALWATLVLIVAIFIRFYLASRNKNDYNYQLARAEACLQRGNYTDALRYVRQALHLSPEAEEARLTEAEIMIQQKDYASALPVLKAVISLNPACLEAYEALIFIYDSEGKRDAVKDLLSDAEDIVRLEFDDFICDAPVFTPSEGVYYDALNVSGTAERDADIYYTLNGADPLSKGQVLRTPIVLGEGEFVFKAIAINENGILSDPVTRSYTVLGADPPAMEIVPVSGDYDPGTSICITARGAAVRYAFDALDAMEDMPADGLLLMPEGRHTLYVFIFDKNENLTALSSRTYFVSSPSADGT